MGQVTTSAKCPQCKQLMGSVEALGNGPNWMAVNGPGQNIGNIILLVCPSFQRQAVLGSYFQPVKPIPER